MTTEIPALDFKSATLYAIRLVLNHGDTDSLISLLGDRMKESGTFFEDEPVVIDATNLTTELDWKKLLTALKSHRLPVIGMAATGEHLNTAKKLGLTPVDLSASPLKTSAEQRASERSTSAPSAALSEPPVAVATDPDAVKITPPETVATAATSPSLAAVQTMVVKGPLRSGQRIYARQRDLIVMGLVSQGAEVIADGNIHIYGPLRGKAMAGALGDTNARIFTTKFEPELVAVAGVYRVIDSKLSADIHQQPVMVFLDGQTLTIKPLDR